MASLIGGVYTGGDTSGGVYYNPQLAGDTYVTGDGYHHAVPDYVKLPEEGFAVGEVFTPPPPPEQQPIQNVVDFWTGENLRDHMKYDPPEPPTSPEGAALPVPLLVGAIVLMAVA